MNEEIITATKITAPPIDMKQFLNEGEIDVSHVPIEDINKILTKSAHKKIIKGTKSYLYPIYCPILLYRTKLFNGRKSLSVSESRTQCFDTVKDMRNFLFERKGTLIMQIMHNTIFDKYAVRYFDIEMTWFKYWMNRLLTWRIKKK